MTSGGGIRTVCRALLAAMGVVLSIPGAAVDDLVGSEQIGVGEAGDAASMTTAGDGHRLWSRQPGTTDGDFARAVTTDKDDNVYVVGETGGALAGRLKGGASDAWVIKFSSNGHRLWSRQPGTSGADYANGVATDKDGNVYVVGATGGALGGPNKGNYDAWVIKFDGDGNRLWTRQPGTSGIDVAYGVATDNEGNISVVGGTEGALGGVGKGNDEAWVIKYDGDGVCCGSGSPERAPARQRMALRLTRTGTSSQRAAPAAHWVAPLREGPTRG